MPVSGSQITLCDFPVRFDSLAGCQFSCSYCFTRRKKDDIIGEDVEVEGREGPGSLLNFIQGKRGQDTNWCDWDIPIHWGGMADPFQPVERTKKIGLECLKIFAETKYPFIVSTKSDLIIEQPYLDLLHNCNVCVQISLVSPEYDKLEPGAPPFAKRVEVIRTISPLVPRVIIRIQPYMIEQLDNVLNITLPSIKEAGAYGCVIEAMKFWKEKPEGTIPVGSDFVYKTDILQEHFTKIRDKAKSLGLAFYCGENRLRWMGDSLSCCGCSDLPGFKGNEYNLNHIYAGESPKPTEAMLKPGTTIAFRTLCQVQSVCLMLKQMTFKEIMDAVANSEYGFTTMGLDLEKFRKTKKFKL
jgi:DNA repair photolyase